MISHTQHQLFFGVSRMCPPHAILKKTVTFLGLFALSSTSAVHGAVSLSGTSILNGANISGGDFAAYVVSTDGSPFDDISVSAGLDLTQNATYGSGFAFVGNKNAQDVFGNVSVPSGITFDLTGGIGTGDSFGVVVFQDSTITSTSILGDSYSIWTDSSWLVPADGATESFGTNISQLDGVAPNFTGTVIPEPAVTGFITVGAAGLVCLFKKIRGRHRKMDARFEGLP